MIILKKTDLGQHFEVYGFSSRRHRERGGKFRESASILKKHLAGGHVILPRLGANAFRWNVAALSLPLHSMVKAGLSIFL